MSSRLGHTGRAPLCPECGYNLVATLNEGWRRCPECGYAFEPHEVRREPAPDDWTLWKGLRAASKMLAARSAIIFAVCALSVLALDWVLALLIANVRGFPGLVSMLVVPVALLIAGFSLGKFLTKDLNERIGVEGFIPAVLATLFCWAALLAGVGLAGLLVAFREISGGPILLLTGGAAMVSIVRHTILADF